MNRYQYIDSKFVIEHIRSIPLNYYDQINIIAYLYAGGYDNSAHEISLLTEREFYNYIFTYVLNDYKDSDFKVA